MRSLHGGVSVNVRQRPRQGSSMLEIRQKMNSWAASHGEKWRCVTTKQEEKTQVHEERNIRCLHIPILIDGGEGNIGRKDCIVNVIEHCRE